GKLTNLNVDERFALNVALRMYTRRIVIQERVEDLQLAVESYQKKINLTKPNTYRSDIKHAEFDESNTHVLERFYTLAGNPVKEILLKLNLPDHRKLKDGGEVKEFQRSFCHSDIERLSRSVKVKEFQERCNIKAFQVNKFRKRTQHIQRKEDGLDSLSFMACAKAALMTFSKDMLIRQSQSQSLCSYAFTLSWPSKKDPPLGDVGEKPKSEKLSKLMAQRFSPPSSGANIVCRAALIKRSRGTLLGGLHDDSQSKIFYYAIFISLKTGLGFGLNGQ
ncbi:hypothetical protein Tco_1148267, partial [Tanacetum coccineum]